MPNDLRDQRRRLQIETIRRRKDDDAWRLTRLNLLRELRFKLMADAKDHQIISGKLNLRLCEFTDKTSNEGHHRMGWDKILRCLDRIGLEVSFTIQRKELADGTRNPPAAPRAPGQGVPAVPHDP